MDRGSRLGPKVVRPKSYSGPKRGAIKIRAKYALRRASLRGEMAGERAAGELSLSNENQKTQ